MKKYTIASGLLGSLLVIPFVSVAVVALAQTAPVSTTPSCAAFTRNLWLGESGADVKQLQVLLNQSTDTRVAVTGNGSPGNESGYFGFATLAAVMKFQNSYSTDLFGLPGSQKSFGFVGMATEAKLISLYCGGGTALSATPAPSTTTGATNLPATLSSIEGPNRLAVGETGTWKIDATDPEGRQLNYAIVWGDEQALVGTYQGLTATISQATVFMPNNIFTHKYAAPGTYKVSFQVMDDSKRITYVKSTITVLASTTTVAH